MSGVEGGLLTRPTYHNEPQARFTLPQSTVPLGKVFSLKMLENGIRPCSCSASNSPVGQRMGIGVGVARNHRE